MRFRTVIKSAKPSCVFSLFGGKPTAARGATSHMQVEPALRSAGKTPVNGIFYEPFCLLTIHIPYISLDDAKPSIVREMVIRMRFFA